MMRQFRHWINGESRQSRDGGEFDSVNPYTQQPWATVALAGEAEVNEAVAAARRAFDDGPWPRMGARERGDILRRLAALIDEHVGELARCDTLDMGKPIKRLLGGEIAAGAGNFRLFADHAEITPAPSYPGVPGRHSFTEYTPAGVVAAISPWNYPFSMATWKIAPALAYGNTVVLKPAEQSPGSAAMLGELALEAGMPAGVLNIVHGYGPGSAGGYLVASPGIDRITFTGSTAAGRAIATVAADRLVPVTLECGGKGPNVVFADADLDVAVPTSVRAICSNSGQVCLVGSRLYVQRPVYDEFVARFVETAEALVLGDPLEMSTDLGPIASREQFERVCYFLGTVPEDGGKVRAGGRGEGWFVRPTVVVDLPRQARAFRQEIFGPVVCIAPFETDEEAIALANDSEYGLAATMFTRDLHRAHAVSRRLRAGTVWVNCWGQRDKRAPFGGFQMSGIGREGGDFSREFFTEPQAILISY